MFGELKEIARRHQASIVTTAVRTQDEAAIDDLRNSGIDVRVVWRERQSRTSRESLSRLLAWASTDLPIGVLDPEAADIVRHISAYEDIDVLHVAASRWASPGLLLAPRYIGRASVLTDHESAPAPGAHRGRTALGTGDRLLELLDTNRWRKFLGGAYALFDRIQVFTAEDAASIARAYPDVAERTTVNPFGVDLPPVDTDNSPTEESLLFVGNFRHPPNLDAARWLTNEIFPRILNERPNARLTLAGAGAHSALVTRAHITVISDVADLAPVYAATSVVVAPLRTGGGMRLKVMEGMAHARPVVCTSIAAAGISVEDAPAPLIVADDAVAFAREVATLLAAPVARLQLAQAARRHVSLYFSWTAYGQRLDRLYSAALQSRKGRPQQIRFEPRSTRS